MTKNDVGKLHIKKRTLTECLALFVFVWPFFFAFLTEGLGLPNMVKYLIDGVLVCLCAVMIVKNRLRIQKQLMPFVALIGVFLTYVFIAYLFNFQSVFYFMWGLRNNFRFFVAFFVVINFLDEDECTSFLKLLDALFWINAIVTMYQFFVLGYNQDCLGGIFGVERGCNGYSLIFMMIVVGKSILSFFNGKEKVFICFIKCGISLVIAALAELKFYFVIFALLLIVASVITRFSLRKFALYFVASIFMMFASSIIVEIFGESDALTWQKLIELATATNYSTAEDLGRITAIPTISKTILTHPLEQIFGLGLGNCDTSTFAICNTPFFQTYSYLNYTWLSSAFMFLENGYVGLVIYLSFFVICCISSMRKMKQENSNKLFCQISVLMSFFAIIFVFYNSSLRTEVGYMVYFTMALPYVNKNKFKAINAN